MTSTSPRFPAPVRPIARRLLPVCAWVFAAAVSATAFADALPDDEPPEVSIKKPKNNLELPAAPQKLTVKVEAEDDESGIMHVELKVDGESVGTLDERPFNFKNVELGPGRHELVATAYNYDDLTADSKPVVVVVAEPEPTPEPAPVEPEAKAETKTDAKAAADTKLETKIETKAETETKIEAKAAPDAKAETKTKAKDSGATKDGCFASVRRRSLAGSGLALLFAAFAGLMLRRRR